MAKHSKRNIARAFVKWLDLTGVFKINGTAVTSTAAELNIMDGVTSTAAELNYNDIAVLGTGAASKAVVLDTGDDYTWPAAGVFTYGVLNDATTTLTATALELNEMNDMSAKVVAPATGNLSVTQALHGNRILYYDDADGAVTLPAASGTGYSYLIVFKTAFTGGTIKCASGTDDFLGGCSGMDTDVDGTAKSFSADAGDDTVTLNGVATGGIAGDWIRFTDVASAKWLVEGWLSFSGGAEATPFSATL